MVRANSLVGCKNFRKHQERIDKSRLEKGILVFTDEATLTHKKRDGIEPSYCYWLTSKIPKKFFDAYLEPDLLYDFPIYFAVKGKVQGFFMVHTADYSDEEDKYELQFYSNSYVEIKHGETLKPSQGWRYYPKEE